MQSVFNLRRINIHTGTVGDDPEAVNIRNCRPWSITDRRRFPEVSASIGNHETAIVDANTGFTYLANEMQLINNGFILSVKI